MYTKTYANICKPEALLDETYVRVFFKCWIRLNISSFTIPLDLCAEPQLFPVHIYCIAYYKIFLKEPRKINISDLSNKYTYTSVLPI